MYRKWCKYAKGSLISIISHIKNGCKTQYTREGENMLNVWNQGLDYLSLSDKKVKTKNSHRYYLARFS